MLSYQYVSIHKLLTYYSWIQFSRDIQYIYFEKEYINEIIYDKITFLKEDYHADKILFICFVLLEVNNICHYIFVMRHCQSTKSHSICLFFMSSVDALGCKLSLSLFFHYDPFGVVLLSRIIVFSVSLP